jgi:hypothetical protein
LLTRAARIALIELEIMKNNPIHFPIDVVYAWADGSDPKYQESLAQVSLGSVRYSRFADNNELWYSLYSIYKFAPWVRKIFIIVADYQSPNLEGLPLSLVNKTILVRQHDIMPASALPTFNSMAIETILHLIPDLSEHFIYFNDDTLLGNHVLPTDFFTATGEGYFFKKWLPRTFFQPIRFLWPEFNYLHQSIKLYWQVAAKKNKSSVVWHGLHHCQPCRKSLFEMLWNHPAAKIILDKTLHSPLRANNNIQPTALMHLTGIESGSMKEKQMPISSHLFLKLHPYNVFFHIQLVLLKKIKPQFLCFNNELKKSSVLERKMNQTLFDYFKPEMSRPND